LCEIAYSLGYFIARKKSVRQSVVGSKVVSPFNLIMHFGEQYAITSADISSTAILSTKYSITKCVWVGWGVGVSCGLNDRLFLFDKFVGRSDDCRSYVYRQNDSKQDCA
jgi:hypothetical protein